MINKFKKIYILLPVTGAALLFNNTIVQAVGNEPNGQENKNFSHASWASVGDFDGNETPSRRNGFAPYEAAMFGWNSNYGDKNIQGLETAKKIAALRKTFKAELNDINITEHQLMDENSNQSIQHPELRAQLLIIQAAQKALEQDMKFSKRNTEFSGRVQNAIILAMAGNKSNINTLEGSVVYLCFRSLSKTIDEKGQLFWGWVFDGIQKAAQFCFLKIGWGSILTDKNIKLLENAAEIIKRQLASQAKHASEAFSSAQALNIRNSQDDQYNFEHNSLSDSKTTDQNRCTDLDPLLDTIVLALQEISLYSHKYEKYGDTLSTTYKILQIIKRRFLELGKIFQSAGSFKNMQAVTKQAQDLCDNIIITCEQFLRTSALNKQSPKKQASYDFFGSRDDKFG